MDTGKHLERATSDYQAALGALQSARAHYHGGSGQRIAQALAARDELNRKINAAQAAAAEADSDFRQAFEAAGYAPSEATRQAQARKNEAQDMLEALRAALARNIEMSKSCAIEASRDGSAYVFAHRAACAAYAQMQVAQALHQAGGIIARAMAISAQIPRVHGIGEDHRGRPAPSAALQREQEESRWAHVIAGLTVMAHEQDQSHVFHDVPEIGALDLGALREGDLLTPAQAHRLLHQHKHAQAHS